MPECHLHKLEDVQGFPRSLGRPGSHVLAIRRYDRTPEGPVHQEDFAQVVGLPPGKKYDQITYEVMARLVQGFIGEQGVDELMRRLVFAIASGNNDAHLKIWCLIYPDKIQARWSPLYDQVATVAWDAPDRVLSLKLAGVKDFGQIDRKVFERFADRVEIDRRRVLDLVDETLERLRQAWQEVSEGLPLPDSHAQRLREHWTKVPLLCSSGLPD